MKEHLLHQRVAVRRGDATHVAHISPYQHVSAHAPGLAPAVLQLPVLLSAQSTVADDTHSVVDVLRAGGLHVDATAVKLKGRLTGVHGARHRTNSAHGVLQRRLTVGSQVSPADDSGANVLASKVTAVLVSAVRVGGGSVQAALVDDALTGKGERSLVLTQLLSLHQPDILRPLSRHCSPGRPHCSSQSSAEWTVPLTCPS